MFIKVEPTDFFMYSVKLIYNLETPDSEDQTVRDYLIENELDPKVTSTGDFEGRNSEMMYFGGCYLGKHLQQIGAIQTRAIEEDILAMEIEKHLTAAQEDPLTTLTEHRKEAIAQLVQEFHRDSSFKTNDEGEMVIALDADEVVQAAKRVVGEGVK